MRIALVCMHTSPGQTPGTGDAGGMNVLVKDAARSLSSRGHEVVAFTRANTAFPPGKYRLNPKLCGHSTLVAVQAGDLTLPKHALPLVLTQFTRSILQYEPQHPFDAVHGHYWLSGIAALSLAARDSITPVVSLHTVAAQKNHTLAPEDQPEPPLRLAAERALTQRAFIVAGSQSELRAIQTGYGTPTLGAHVIHPGVDTTLFQPRKQLHAPSTPGITKQQAHTPNTQTPFRITVLGRVQPLKGQDLAVRAFAKLATQDPQLASRTELVIAGEPTPGHEAYAATLHRIAADEGVTSQIRFLPSQTRHAAAQLLASSDIVLVPSRSETFGLVAIEAAAAGTPTIVAAHTGLLEAAPEGVSAVHVTGRDPEAWAEAIQSLLHDPKRHAHLSVTARTHALTYDWDEHARALENIYAQVQRHPRDNTTNNGQRQH